ncbi:hypothetical protein NUITMVRA1_12910 [Aerococcus viridans]|uniref:hypothetical protein n=1 Tax=Aerococcus viridans TaxID=1377 RepID=UPI0028FDA379|nr:hypothetical protein NUITMVRA1_12910 [Aerococcus viridans]
MEENEYNILQIPNDTQYWLVRADGGKYYDEFKFTKSISIKENEIKLEDLRTNEKLLVNTEQSLKYYKEVISKIYPNKSKQQISIIAKKNYNFIEEMKVGDIVLVPSFRSTKFLIGVVTSEVLEKSQNQIDNDLEMGINYMFPVSENMKYRKINWVNEVPRSKLNPKILYTLTMHQTIINITDSGDLINNLISPIYIKYGVINVSLSVNTKKPIDSESWEALYSLVNEYRNDNIGERITVKSNVESPGFITLSTTAIINSQILDNSDPIFLGIIAIALLFGEINTNYINLKGLFPYLQVAKKNKLEIKRKELENEKIEIENDGLRVDLEEKKEKQEVDKLKRDLERRKLTAKIREMDLGIDTPNVKNESLIQTQMDLSENEDEE